jgi:ATP-dependent Clp protease ATP-binding subunit ClpC
VGALREAGVRAAGAGKRSARRGTGARPRDDDPLAGLSKNARLAVAAAMEGAIGLGHGFLGCEHLVLGLAGQAGGKAAELLGGLGIDEDRVRRAIPAALGAAALGYRHGSQMLASPATGRLDDITRRLDQLEQRLRSAGL